MLSLPAGPSTQNNSGLTAAGSLINQGSNNIAAGAQNAVTGANNALGNLGSAKDDILSGLLSGNLGNMLTGVGQSTIGQGGSPFDWLMGGGAGRALTQGQG